MKLQNAMCGPDSPGNGREESHLLKKPTGTVDTYIEQVPDGQIATVRILRDLVRKTAPGLAETIKWGHLCYVGAGNVCSIIPYSEHVNLAFFRGAHLDDPEKVLEGAGKEMRHVKIRSVKEIRKRALAALIRAAASLKLDE